MKMVTGILLAFLLLFGALKLGMGTLFYLSTGIWSDPMAPDEILRGMSVFVVPLLALHLYARWKQKKDK